MIDFVNVNGDRIDPHHTPSALAPRPPKPKKDGPAEHHKGWVVVGYEPGLIDRAMAVHAEVEETPFDLIKWMRHNRKTKVRARPFEVPSAADEMKALAEKAGWQHVEVIELAKRSA